MNEEDEDRHRLYDILNVGHTASDAEIRDSHRRLSRLFHPDKHTSSAARSKADPKFQEIQYAFEVLSDPRKRMIYDTLGEPGLAIKMDVGQKHMSPEELKVYFQKHTRQAQIDTLQSLIQNRGESSINLDARSMFGARVVMEKHTRIGSMLPITVARPATLQERLGDVMFRGMSMRNSWTIPFNFATLLEIPEEGDIVTQPVVKDNPSSLTLTTNTVISAKRQLMDFGLTATLRHQFSSSTNVEASLPILSPQRCEARIVHHYSPDMFMSANVAQVTLASPPDIALLIGRQITDRGILCGKLRSGTPWKLAGWGQHGNAAAYVLEWTHTPTPTDPTGFSLELVTGLQTMGISADYKTEFVPAGIRFKAACTAYLGGLAMNIGASRKVTEHTRLGATVSANAQSLILKLSVTRLGQTLNLPIWIGDGLERDSIVFGVLLPLGGLIAYEYLVIRPRAARRTKQRTAKKRQAFKDKLAEKERSAREAVELMSDAVQRRQQLAQAQGSLSISSATYGSRDCRIDVTIAVAALVNDGQLVLASNQRKAALYGFWDPDFGVKKTLRIDYLFGGQRHFIEVEDRHGVALPSHSHLM